MRIVLVLLAGLMLATNAFATKPQVHLNNNCNANGAGDDIVCSDVSGDVNTTTINGGVDIDNSTDNSTTINGGIDRSTSTIIHDNSTTDNSVDNSVNNSATGGAGGDGYGVGIGTGGSVGDTSATGGSVGDVNTTVNFGGGEGGEGSFNSSSDSSVGDITNDNTNRLIGGDNTNTNIVGGGTAISGGGEGGSVNVGDTSVTGGDNTNRLVGGDTTIGDTTSDSSTTIGDTTLNNDSTSSAYNGGNTLIVGGGQGECYEGECEGGSGTLNSNAENNVDIANDNASNAEGGDANVTVNIGEDGPLTASSQSVDTASSSTIEEGAVVVEGDEITYEATRMPVNSAAPSFSGICNSGAAGSGSKISLSFAVTNDVCQCLMIADAYMAMGDVEEAHNWVKAAARHAKWKGGVGYIRHLVTLGIL